MNMFKKFVATLTGKENQPGSQIRSMPDAKARAEMNAQHAAKEEQMQRELEESMKKGEVPLSEEEKAKIADTYGKVVEFPKKEDASEEITVDTSSLEEEDSKAA